MVELAIKWFLGGIIGGLLGQVALKKIFKGLRLRNKDMEKNKNKDKKIRRNNQQR